MPAQLGLRERDASGKHARECWDGDADRYALAGLTLLYYCITTSNEDGCQDQMDWQEGAHGHDCCDLVLCYGIPAPPTAAMCPLWLPT